MKKNWDEQIRKRQSEYGADRSNKTDKHKFCFLAYEVIERVVKPHSTSAHIGVPKTWTGCRVAIIRLDKPLDSKPLDSEVLNSDLMKQEAPPVRVGSSHYTEEDFI